MTVDRAESAPRVVGDIIPPPTCVPVAAKSSSLVIDDAAVDGFDLDSASAGGRVKGGGACFGLTAV